MRTFFLVMSLSLALAPAAARAQAVVRSPHGQLDEACATCHRADGWSPARVAKGYRHAEGRFALDGAHATTSCTGCHTSLDFQGTPSRCASCHSDVHQGELGTDCARCHSTRSFIDRAALLRAHQLTRFALRGAHVAADCEQCHPSSARGSLRFVGRPTVCAACHADAVAATKEPDHDAAGFSRECEQCHYPVAWNRARFDHASTSFPLTGAHRAAGCADCHADRVYDGKPSTCVSCHQADYDATTSPQHATMPFPTTCESCHGTTTWLGAKFDHDPFFPIYSGKHRSVWSSCSTCHTTPGNYAVFTCLTCHGQTAMDDKHKSFAGYRYESTVCYSCHADGTKP